MGDDPPWWLLVTNPPHLILSTHSLAIGTCQQTHASRGSSQQQQQVVLLLKQQERRADRPLQGCSLVSGSKLRRILSGVSPHFRSICVELERFFSRGVCYMWNCGVLSFFFIFLFFFIYPNSMEHVKRNKRIKTRTETLL